MDSGLQFALVLVDPLLPNGYAWWPLEKGRRMTFGLGEMRNGEPILGDYALPRKMKFAFTCQSNDFHE
jgi:hypothetical protein